MKTYLLTAAGVIFFSVIVSLIIPEGKLNKSIVFVMRMACILVLLQPISGLFDFSSVSTDELIYDYEYITNVYSDNQSKELEKLIYKEFSAESNCLVEILYDEGNFKVGTVSVEIISDNKKLIDEIQSYLKELGYINITVYAKSY